MTRSALFCLALLASAAAPAEAATSGRVEFEITRNGNPEGRHVVAVRAAGDAVTVSSEVSIRVRAGPLTLYRYQQRCQESWTAGALASFDCSTTKNGRRTDVTARRQDEGLVVAAGGEDLRFPLGALPTSWWTKPPTSARTLINVETGRAMPVTITRVGREMLTIDGTAIAVERIRVAGTATADLLYDAQGRWIGCEFTASGQRFIYRLVSAPSAAPSGV